MAMFTPAPKKFANPTRNYLPAGNSEAWFGFPSSILDATPVFTWVDVPRMLRDERIQLCLRYLTSPLKRVKWKLRGSSPAVVEFAKVQTRKFWKKYVTKIARRYFKWGAVPVGFEYHNKKGMVELRRVDIIDTHDAQPLEYKSGEKKNTFAGFTFPGGKAFKPFAAWFAGEGEVNRYYDWPRLRGAYQPWIEKNGRTGAKHSRRLAAVSAWDNGVLRFPTGPVNIGTEESPNWIDGQYYAMELASKREAGARTALPNSPNLAASLAGKYAWELEPGRALANLEPIFEYPSKLDHEIDSGMGVPTEVIEATENGGWSGRAIPAEAFYSSEDEIADGIMELWTSIPLQAMIGWNFGAGHWCEIEPMSLVDTLMKSKPAGAPTQPGQPGGMPGMGQPQPGTTNPNIDPEDLFGGDTDQPKPPADFADDGDAFSNKIQKEMSKGGGDDAKARRAVMLAMLHIQEEATAKGNPDAAGPWLDELADLAKDPRKIRELIGTADFAWSADGVSRSGKKRWLDSETGQRRYQESMPGSRAEARERRTASDAGATHILDKISRHEASHEDVATLSDHLPAASLEKIRMARKILGASFGGHTRRQAMIDSLLTHVAERVRGQKAGEEARGLGKKSAPEDGSVPDKPELGKVYNVDPKQLHVDPERFQFKLNTDAEKGVGDELKGVKFNPDFAGVISVWRDPADGKSYVINGHHRHDLASRTGAERMAVRYLDAPDAQTARGKGALINIAGGRGTSIDAAKFMRDTGVGVEQFAAEGVSLKGAIARDAVDLSKLADPIFNRLMKGDLDESRALGIAKNILDPELQVSFLNYVEKAEEKKDRELTPKVVASMAAEWAHAPTRKKVESSLFGDVESTHSLFADRHELKSHVREQLAKEERDFAAVSSERRAGRVAEEGNKLETEKNRQRANTAGRLRDMLDNADPRWSDLLDQGAEAHANAKNSRERERVRREYAERIRATLSEAHAGAIQGVDEGRSAAPIDGAGRRDATESGGSEAGASGDVDAGHVSGQIDIFGKGVHPGFGGKKDGAQLQIGDHINNVWMDKAREFAESKGHKAEKFGFGGTFQAGGKTYRVSSPETGHKISEEADDAAGKRGQVSFPGKLDLEPEKRVADNPDEFVNAYLNTDMGRKNADGSLKGVTVNTDEARPLFAEYRGTNSGEVHEASSAVSKRVLAKALNELKGKGNNRFLVLAGGGGSGKGTATKGKIDEHDYPIVLDQTSDNYSKLQSKFAEATANGFHPEYVFVDRDPASAWEGVVGRAQSARAKGGHARTVPLETALHANIEARKVAIQVLKNNPEVLVSIIDNNRGFGKAHRITDRDEAIQYLEGQQYDHDSLLEKLKNETASRQLDDDIKQGLIGNLIKAPGAGERSDAGRVQSGSVDGSRGNGAQADGRREGAESGTDGTGQLDEKQLGKMTRAELESHYTKRVDALDAAGVDISKSDELRDIENRVTRKWKAEQKGGDRNQAIGEMMKSADKKLPKAADLIEAAGGEHVTADDAEKILVHAGVDEIGAADRRFDLEEKYGDKISVKTLAIIARSARHYADADGRRNEALKAAGTSKVVVFGNDEGRKMVIHPSTYEPGKWQLSRLDKDGPMGHSNFDTRDEAIASAVAAHPKGGMYNDGDADMKFIEGRG